MQHKTAIKQGLEPVYPECHELGERIFWDRINQLYYDASTDLHLYDFDYLTNAGIKNI